jgi:hypothetical protein
MQLAWWLQRLSWRDGPGRLEADGRTLLKGADEPHNTLGYRPPLLEAIRGQVSGPLPAPTRVSPAPTTEYKQYHQNDH